MAKATAVKNLKKPEVNNEVFMALYLKYRLLNKK